MGESSPNGTLLMTYAKFQRRNAKSAVEMTMLMLLAAQLRQIPNCSEESAKAIARTFGTMNNIMTFVNEVGNVSDTINFISNIRREGEKGRRVGVSLAEYIVKLFSKKPW